MYGTTYITVEGTAYTMLPYNYSHIRLVSMMQFSCKATIYLQHQLFKVAELVYIISYPKTPSV